MIDQISKIMSIQRKSPAFRYTKKTEASPLLNNQTGRRDATNMKTKLHIDNKVAYFLEGVSPASVSKVVDENGEPLVVYHRTNLIWRVKAIPHRLFE